MSLENYKAPDNLKCQMLIGICLDRKTVISDQKNIFYTLT